MVIAAVSLRRKEATMATLHVRRMPLQKHHLQPAKPRLAVQVSACKILEELIMENIRPSQHVRQQLEQYGVASRWTILSLCADLR